ncbi:MAG: tandem-95 repeat protein, partial [Novosphingobium sp.]|nr:tandem-95 repeat protein [Novosphingobium sp.]
ANEDTAKQVTVAGSDVDGDTLSYSAGSASHGSVTGGSGGVFTYTPNANYNGSDSFVVTVSDGKGGTANQTVNVSVTAVNDAPTVQTSQSVITSQDTAEPVVVAGSDADGDVLTYSAGSASHGTVTGGSGGVFVYGPDANFSGTDSFVITVSDGNGGKATQIVNVTVAAVNDAPAVVASLNVWTDEGTAMQVAVAASDAEGDVLTYSAGTDAHGSVTGGSGGVFTYTPSANFSGTDSFVVNVSDGNGGTATQTVNVTVISAEAALSTLRLFASDDFSGELGGTGTLFGTNGVQDITICDQLNNITFDASFNRGGDIIRLPGDADAYAIALSGSLAVLTDGDSRYQIPLGTNGVSLAFDDGVRTLRFDNSTSEAKIGSQTIDGAYAPITALAEGTPQPSEPASTGLARSFLVEGGEIFVGGSHNVFGTSAAEHVHYLYGDLSLDPSFNRGGDTLYLPEIASSYAIHLSGSLVVLTSGDDQITIPVGTAGMTIDIAGDQQLLRFETASSMVKIGDSVVTATSLEEALPVGQSGPANQGALDQSASSSEIAVSQQPDSLIIIAGDDQIHAGGIDDWTAFSQIAFLDATTSGTMFAEAFAEAGLGWNFITFA